MNEASLITPGKVNLYLEITGRRPDGYHELWTVFYPTPHLTDRVTVRFGGSGISVVCGTPGVPQDDSNLAVKAAKAFFAASGESCPDLEIHIEKYLPVAGGMGGGSSDAGAVLRLLQQLTGNALSPELLSAAALSIGADVPFFLNPVASVGCGRGEILTPVDLPAELPLLILPGIFPVSAAWAYRHWRDIPAASEISMEPLPELLRFGDYAAAGKCLRNDLAPAVMRKFPLLQLLSEILRDSGGAPLMSGSGPTMFALYADFAARDRAQDCLKHELEKYCMISCKA